MYVSFFIYQVEYCNLIVYMVRVYDIFCLNLMKKYVVWGVFFREVEKSDINQNDV